MKRVRFNKSCAPYNTGEIAGFDDDKAQMLIDKGMATLVTEVKAESSPKKHRRSLGENRQVTTD